ncbi:MAG: hypothetical protein RBR86_07260 [Pseudobdellovibrionaceae bacterium]|jgi:hypothetical protein|nr:hypothetical protein [Pseudobdellovibrionaceae bacterium]
MPNDKDLTLNEIFERLAEIARAEYNDSLAQGISLQDCIGIAAYSLDGDLLKAASIKYSGGVVETGEEAFLHVLWSKYTKPGQLPTVSNCVNCMVRVQNNDPLNPHHVQEAFTVFRNFNNR